MARKPRRKTPGFDWPKVAGYDPSTGATRVYYDEDLKTHVTVFEMGFGELEYYYDAEAGQRVVDFFAELLVHQKGEWQGQPILLQPWQDATARSAFGWKNKANGFRRYRIVWVYVPRKNGKSTLSSGFALYLLFADDEPGAEVFSAAGDKEQALMVYGPATYMVAEEEELNTRCRVYETTKQIKLADGSFYKAISAEAYSKHGMSPSGVVFDEVHVQPDRELWDVLQTGMGSRQQPLTFALTTADHERPSLCNEWADYAKQIRDGYMIDPTFFPVIFEAEEEDDWESEATWKKANPNYGVSLKAAYIQDEYIKAKRSPAFENTFKRLHLNIRTQQETRVIPMDKWKKCEEYEEYDLTKFPAVAGLDLSLCDDITAYVPVFRIPDPKKGRIGREDYIYITEPMFWVPENNPQVALQYAPWISAGYIRTTRGDIIDYKKVRKDINTFNEEHDVWEIPLDRWNAAKMGTELGEEDGNELVAFGQGFASMSEPTKYLLTLVRKGQLVHNNNPVLTWMASNAAGRTDEQDNIKLVKTTKRGGRLKIDGVICLIMALGRWLTNPSPKKSPYAERGLLVF